VLSLVIPVYRNESGVPALLEAVEDLAKSVGSAFEAVFVVDGSPDRCYALLREALPRAPYRSRLVLLARNFGSFAAIRAGLGAGDGTHFAVMAADLQEPPELVLQMDRVLRTEPVDVVIAARNDRSDPLFSRLSSGMFWWFYRRFVIPEIPAGGVDIFACSRAFREQLLSLSEHHSSLVAQIFWLGYTRKTLHYTRRARQHGRSAWTFRKKLKYLMDSVFSFTDLPIRLLTYGGGATALAAAAFGAFVALCRLLGLVSTAGYGGTICTIVFFGALNLFALGVVGSYAWRAYENTKARPLQLIMRTHAFAPAQQKSGAA
jgi:glycosyltransferase involved in cell wall biosynthesis